MQANLFGKKRKFIKALSWKKYPAKKSLTITKRPRVNGYLLLRCPLAFES